MSERIPDPGLTREEAEAGRAVCELAQIGRTDSSFANPSPLVRFTDKLRAALAEQPEPQTVFDALKQESAGMHSDPLRDVPPAAPVERCGGRAASLALISQNPAWAAPTAELPQEGRLEAAD